MREKNCYCHTCKKDYHHLGIMRHRAIHRDKKEDVTISYTYDTYTHNFSKNSPAHKGEELEVGL